MASADVRAARPRTSTAVLAVWGEARSSAAVTPDTAEGVARVIERGTLFVAEADGHVVGALIAGWDGWRGNDVPARGAAVTPAPRDRPRARRAGHARLRELGAPRVTALVGLHQDDGDRAVARDRLRARPRDGPLRAQRSS